VNEAIRLGVNEVLTKPTSPKMFAGPLVVDPGQSAPDGADW